MSTVHEKGNKPVEPFPDDDEGIAKLAAAFGGAEVVHDETAGETQSRDVDTEKARFRPGKSPTSPQTLGSGGVRPEVPESPTGAVDLIGAYGVETANDPAAATLSILRRVFRAKDVDALFGVWEPTSSDKLVGRSFLVRGVEWGIYTPHDEKGNAKDPLPLARVDYYLDEDESKSTDTFITTAVNLTGFLRQVEQLGGFPVRFRIVGTKTGRNHTVLYPARP